MAASDLSLHLAKDVGPRGRTGPLFYQTYSNKGQWDSSGLWHNSMRLQAAMKILFKSTAPFISDCEIGLDFLSCSCRACGLAGRSYVDTDGLNAGVADGSISYSAVPVPVLVADWWWLGWACWLVGGGWLVGWLAGLAVLVA